MFKDKKHLLILLLCTFIIILGLIFPQGAKSQYWAAIPPYNVLWPLWSAALSPVDPLTGLPTALVNQLTRHTILPVQPTLVWDPCQPSPEAFPWLVYNIPFAFGGGLIYWDVYYGMNPWPPNYMLDPITGAPAPISLPVGWSGYLPTRLEHFDWFVPLTNAIFSSRYAVPISSLLTTADIWGFPALATLPPPIF